MFFFSFQRKFEVNIWSSFEIKGNPDMTLEAFMKEVEVKHLFCLFIEKYLH